MKFSERHSEGTCLVLILILAFTIGTYGHAQASTSWPNEPASSTVIMDCDFTVLLCNGALTSAHGGAFQASLSSNGQLSPTNAIAWKLSEGATGGGDVLYHPFSPTIPTLYVGIWWKMNASFQGYSNLGNKVLFTKGVDGNGNKSNAFWAAYGNPGGPFQWVWNSQGLVSPGVYDNKHLSNSFGVFHFGNNCGVSIAVDTWHKIEMLQRASTSSTSQDGLVQWWVDGTLCGDYRNANVPPFNDFQFESTWQGFCTVQWPCPTADWIHYVDHLHISKLGGTVDATPPSAPNGLTVR